MSNTNVRRILDRICDWSRAHRAGEELSSDRERLEGIDAALRRLQHWADD